jgi:transposase InsO family protein
LIRRELVLAGRIQPGSVSVSTIGRILKRAGLSGPRLELERPARYRWRAAHVNDIWQGDALHGPRLLDPRTGQTRKAITFGLLDDRSRFGVRLWANVQETEEAFLHVLYEAMARRGIPGALLLDRHASFRGHGLRLVCGHLNIRLIYTRRKDGPGKGAVERWWRTLRHHVLDRLDPERVQTIDDLNARLVAWCEGEYNHRPHSALGGRSPMAVWQEEAERIEWVQDHAALEALFVGREMRKVLNDSTISFRGTPYEVPTHLRRRKVEVHYSLLNPDSVWILDGDVEVPVRPVDPERNASRPREATKPPVGPKAKTGLNHVELLLDRICGRRREEVRHA